MRILSGGLDLCYEILLRHIKDCIICFLFNRQCFWEGMNFIVLFHILKICRVHFLLPKVDGISCVYTIAIEGIIPDITNIAWSIACMIVLPLCMQDRILQICRKLLLNIGVYGIQAIAVGYILCLKIMLRSLFWFEVQQDKINILQLRVFFERFQLLFLYCIQLCPDLNICQKCIQLPFLIQFLLGNHIISFIPAILIHKGKIHCIDI